MSKLAMYELSKQEVEQNWHYIEFLVDNTPRAVALPLNEYSAALQPEKTLNFIMGLFNPKNELIGTILYRLTGSEIDLREILVLQNCQNSGLGSLLIKGLIENFKAVPGNNVETSHMRYITLQVKSNDDRLIAFYTKFGFIKIATRYPAPTLVKHDLMELDLYVN